MPFLLMTPALGIGDGDDLQAQDLLAQKGRVLSGVAETLDGRVGALQIHALDLGRLAGDVDPAPGRGVAPTGRTADGQGLAGDDPGVVVTPHGLILVHHPGHYLGGGVDVRGRDIDIHAQGGAHGPDIGPGEALLLGLGELLGVAGDPALAAAQRDIHHRALPGHPGGQGPDRVDGLVRMPAQPALGRSPGLVVLNPVGLENLDPAVVHPDRKGYLELLHGPPQKLVGGRIQTQPLGGVVQL